MIGQLRGRIIHKQAPELVLDVNGVGYEIKAPMTTFYKLPENQEIKLYTHLSVREDAQELFGFYTQAERHLFRTLIKVSGVGPRLALAILSGMEVDEFVSHIRQDNSQALIALPGVGKKTAQRLIVEMQDRLKDWQVTIANEQTMESTSTNDSSAHHSKSVVIAEAQSALVALGYKLTDAHKMVSRAIIDLEQSNTDTMPMKSETLIRFALKSTVTH